MAELNQIPGRLNIRVISGDDLMFVLNFGMDLSSHTFVAKVLPDYLSDTGGTAISIESTDLVHGIITLSLTDTQITALPKKKNYWYLKWTIGDMTRKIIDGDFIVQNVGE